eukprot:4674037-Amphidinium_carterae.1
MDLAKHALTLKMLARELQETLGNNAKYRFNFYRLSSAKVTSRSKSIAAGDRQRQELSIVYLTDRLSLSVIEKSE